MKARKKTLSIVATISTLALLPSLSRAVTLADLQGYWTFDNSGNLGEDSSPNGNDLTASGTPTFNASGVFGGRLDLDGPGQNDVLTSGVFPTGIPTGSSSYAVSAWINANIGNNNGGFISWGGFSGNNTNAHRQLGATGYRHYWWGNDLDATGLSNQETGDPPGGWHHYVAQYDSGSGTRELWIDGSMVVSDSPGAPNVTAANFNLGKTVNTEYWNGQLDDVAVFSMALSSSDIAFLYNSGSGNTVAALIPEPTTGVLSLIGLGLVLRRRR